MGTATTTAAPAVVPEEDRRQRAVESLALAEGQPVERLDRITRLARTIFEVPFSSIAVLDGDRAWFASIQGADLRGLPRQETFSDRADSASVLLVVEDTASDPRFADLPAVTDDGIRFYAGQPLRDSMGNVLGTLGLFDVVPRTLDQEQLTTLVDLAAWAEQELTASTEMTQARRVQSSLLPARPVRVPGWTVDGLCLPALAVGGDFYDYGVGHSVAHVSLGDVMGKGTGAALLGAGVRAAIRGTHEAVVAGVDLGITATQVARSLLPDLERAESFVTLLEAAVDLDDGFVRLVDAGSGLALVVRADGTATNLRGEDRPFGVLPDDHWSEQQLDLDPGDRLLLFSDGLLDLLDDPVDWVPEVGALVHRAEDGPGVLASVLALGHARTPLDDVTAVVVVRERGQ
ncbi:MULTISPECIES: PP2C family protein-serine/threonine phosphatase [unclassified Nocardioides]|uniref:PP2C family protein-serine/threonine phosphatase n=1 Tax=unclassified Nocardioides TaxID=2615069 RepID=UPI0030157BAD